MSARKPKAKTTATPKPPKTSCAERIRAAAMFKQSDIPPSESKWDYMVRQLASLESALWVANFKLTALRAIATRQVEIEGGAE